MVLSRPIVSVRAKSTYLQQYAAPLDGWNVLDGECSEERSHQSLRELVSFISNRMTVAPYAKEACGVVVRHAAAFDGCCNQVLPLMSMHELSSTPPCTKR